LPEEKQRVINSEELRHLQLELPEDNHTDARKRIKAIWDFVTCRGCCRPDVSGMIIQDRMLMMADQSSAHDSFQTPSLRIRRVLERANVGFPSYQDAWKLLFAQFVETRPCKLG